jgi:hypothetical protein
MVCDCYRSAVPVLHNACWVCGSFGSIQLFNVSYACLYMCIQCDMAYVHYGTMLLLLLNWVRATPAVCIRPRDAISTTRGQLLGTL